MLRADGFRSLASLPKAIMAELKPELRWQLEKSIFQDPSEVAPPFLLYSNQRLGTSSLSLFAGPGAPSGCGLPKWYAE